MIIKKDQLIIELVTLNNQTETSLSLLSVLNVDICDWNQKRVEIFNRLRDALKKIQKELRIFLYIREGPWRDDTVRQRKFNFWKGIQKGVFFSADTLISSQEIFEKDGKIQFTGTLKIEDTFSEELKNQWVWNQQSFLVAGIKKPEISSFIHRGWLTDKKTQFFWETFGSFAAQEDFLLFRPIGFFDDREVGFYIYGRHEKLKTLLDAL